MSTIPFETNPSLLDSNKKVLFNINWDLSAGAVRQLEIDAFKCLNSNVNNIQTLYSPIDGTTTKSDTTLFFARTRLIKLIDIWNRIINSGLFNYAHTCPYFSTTNINSKIIGANLTNEIPEFLFKKFDQVSINKYPLDFETSNIFNRIIKFIVANVNNYTWYASHSNTGSQFFNLVNTTFGYGFSYLINTNFNPNTNGFLGLMNELIDIVKDLIDETKLANLLNLSFIDLDINTAQGRTNLLLLDTYKSNYKALAKIDLSYLNDETKVLAQSLINSGSTKVERLYPQFASLISRNTENEPWLFRNVAIDTTSFNPFSINPVLDPALKPYQTKYLVCSQLDMKKPLVFDTQFINWNNPEDRPYIMLYNGGTLIYLPDEIKNQTTLNTLGEQPDNQLNLCAFAWKIGTSNKLDPHFNIEDDIKLKLPESIDLYSIDKMDYLDNLTIYLKIN